MNNENIKFIEYDNNKLIDFYVENELEFDEEKGYFGENVKSLVILENNKIIGAVSFSVYKGKSFIEALAVDKKYRGKGYGKLLIKKAIDMLDGDIYVISKVHDFYLKNGFKYSHVDLLGKECKTCQEYNITCFPKVMMYKHIK